jgi:hypothetical protein
MVDFFQYYVSFSEEERKTLSLIKSMKGGELFRSKDRSTVHYLHPKLEYGLSYPSEHEEYLLEWGSLDLKLSASQKKLIEGIESIHENIIPVFCRFNDGVESHYCLLKLDHGPPDGRMLKKISKTPDWYYLNQVEEMKTSGQVLPADVLREMKRMKKKSKKVIEKIGKLKGNLLENPEYYKLLENTQTVIRDGDHKLYKFSDPELFIYQSYINMTSITLINEPSQNEIESAQQLSPNRTDYERGRNYQPPVKNISVLTDF